MSIKVCVLADSERVICDFYEVRDSFRKTIGYAMINPQIIGMTKVIPTTRTNSPNPEPSFSVTMTSWNPFAKTQFFKVNLQDVLCINDPTDDIAKIYKEQYYLEDFLDNHITDETLEIINYDNSNR